MTSTPRRTTQRPEPELADLVDELTRPHLHRERFNRDQGGHRHRTRSRYHVTRVPALVAQLERTESTGAEPDTGMTRGFESRPVARLEALDTLTSIDTEAGAWLRILQARHIPGTTTGRVRAVYARTLDPNTEPRDRRLLIADLRRWHTRARVVTGWDAPAWRPASTCPLCGEYGTLRVKWLDEVATCVQCGEAWDSDTIGLLADHVRAEAEATRTRTAVPACYCPLPMPEPHGLRLCSTCGSARCIRALTVQPLDEGADHA